MPCAVHSKPIELIEKIEKERQGEMETRQGQSGRPTEEERYKVRKKG